MASKKRKEPFCADTLNSLAKNDREFHWSRAYSWYLDLITKDVSTKHLRTTSLAKVGCMLEVFHVLDFVSWCAERFNASRRVIQVGETIVQPISLDPLVF